MKDFVEQTAEQGKKMNNQANLEINLSGDTVTAYVLRVEAPEGISAPLSEVSFNGKPMKSARVFKDQAALGAALAAGVGPLEEVDVPVGDARDAFLKKWAKAAAKNKKGLASVLLLPLAACGGGSEVVEATFFVTETVTVGLDNKIEFSGTQVGEIVATTAGGTTTFARGGLTASNTVDAVFASGSAKELVVGADQALVISGDQVDGGDLNVTGSGGVRIDATDAGAGTVTAITTTVDVAMANGTFTFDLSNDAEDTITLAAGSAFNLGAGGVLVVSDGHVIANAADIDTGSVTLNSELSVSLADYKKIEDLGGFAGTGTLSALPAAGEVDLVGNSTNLADFTDGMDAAVFDEAQVAALFTAANTAHADGNLGLLADGSVSVAGAVDDTAVLTVIQANSDKFADNAVTDLTLADDDAIVTFSTLIADASVAANSITLTDGQIALADAKTAVLADLTKFKADQIDSMSLSDAEAAVEGRLADDAFNANSVTIGAVDASEAIVLANGRKIADDGITAISITAAEFDTFVDANGALPFNAGSVTLGAVTTNVADVSANISKVAVDGITSITVSEAQYKALFVTPASADADANLTKFADSTITISGAVLDVAVLTSLQTNKDLLVDGAVADLTLADDDAIDTFSTLIADASVAADAITLTDGEIALAGAKTAVLAGDPANLNLTKFKADQINSMSLSDAEAAVEGRLADDAFNANSVTIGAVDASEAIVLANGREIANDGITAISITAAEFDTFIDANGADPFRVESVTLGTVTTNVADVLANISKVADGGITSITMSSEQFHTLVVAGADAYDALANSAVTISDPVLLVQSGSVAQQSVLIADDGVSTANGITISGADFETLTNNNAAALENGSAAISGSVSTGAGNSQSQAVVDHVVKLIEGTVSGIDMTADQYQALVDVKDISSTLFASSANSPVGGAISNASDGVPTSSYQNTDKVGSGIVAGLASSQILRSIEITTANNSPEGDPSSISVFGWTHASDPTAGATDSVMIISRFDAADWAPIAVDVATNLSTDRLSTQTISIADNNTSYQYYKVVFTGLRDADAASGVQVAELNLKGADPLALKSVEFADAIDTDTVADIVAEPNKISNLGVDDATISASEFEALFSANAAMLDTGAEGAVIDTSAALPQELRQLLTSAKLSKIQTFEGLDFELDSFASSETESLLSKAAPASAVIDAYNANPAEMTHIVTHIANIAVGGIRNTTLTSDNLVSEITTILGSNATANGSVLIVATDMTEAQLVAVHDAGGTVDDGAGLLKIA